MGTNKQSGFTIVEVTLFLALSGLLAAMLLFGWTNMINAQRYKDSTRTFQAFLQQQYTNVYNVQNGRNQNLNCGLGGVTSGTSNRGTTDCVLLGRYVMIGNGQQISVSAITGTEPAVEDATNDYDAIMDYNPRRVNASIGLTADQLDIPWQATVGPSASPRNIAIAIVRSPLTGVVHTYWANATSATPPAINAVIATTNERRLDMCVDSGIAFTGANMGVRIEQGASSQDFVRQLTESEGVC